MIAGAIGGTEAFLQPPSPGLCFAVDQFLSAGELDLLPNVAFWPFAEALKLERKTDD
jgi:hypothetical protein